MLDGPAGISISDISQVPAIGPALGSIVEESIEECEVVHTSKKKFI